MRKHKDTKNQAMNKNEKQEKKKVNETDSRTTNHQTETPNPANPKSNPNLHHSRRHSEHHSVRSAVGLRHLLQQLPLNGGVRLPHLPGARVMVKSPGLGRRARGRGQVSGHLEHHACARFYVNHVLGGSRG